LIQTPASFGAHHESLNGDRPILLATKMQPNGNIKFMRVFAGFPGEGIKRKSGNRKRRFRTLRFRHLGNETNIII